MQYRAAVKFADLKDGRHIYEAGDTYPRPGLTVSAARLEELSSGRNAMGYPLITAVPEVKRTRKRVESNVDD